MGYAIDHDANIGGFRFYASNPDKVDDILFPEDTHQLQSIVFRWLLQNPVFLMDGVGPDILHGVRL